RLGRQQAGQHAAGLGSDDVLAVVALDAAARVEDVDNQVALGVDRHAGQVGADLGALAAVRVTLGTLVLEDHLAQVGVPFAFGQRHQLVHDLLAVGVGQATAAAGQQLLGPRGDLL